MTITVDKRRIEARAEPEAQRRVAAARDTLRDLQISLARDLARIDRAKAFVYGHPRETAVDAAAQLAAGAAPDEVGRPGSAIGSCASIVEYGTRLGFSAGEVRTFTQLGHTLEAHPEAEAMLRDGNLTIEAAAAIGRLLSAPHLLQPGDQWLTYATTEPLRLLRRRVRERFELHAQGELGLEEVHVLVTAKARDRFDRAKELASQAAGKPLTDGQTFTRVVDFYVEKHDPLHKRGRTRRVPDTRTLPRSRYIPAEVRREVRLRSGGCCEVPTCEHRIGLEFAHRTPHALGSGREVADIGELCHRHHLLYDAGKIPWPVPRPGGPADGQPEAPENGPNGRGRGGADPTGRSPGDRDPPIVAEDTPGVRGSRVASPGPGGAAGAAWSGPYRGTARMQRAGPAQILRRRRSAAPARFR